MQLDSTFAQIIERIQCANENGNDADKQQAIGELALLLTNVVWNREEDLFRLVLREVGQYVQNDEAKWMFRLLKKDLTPELTAWFEDQVQQIMTGSE